MYKPFGYLNFYRVLNVNKDASVEEIKEAFRQLAMRCHPDKSGSAATEEEFKKILHAYNVLTDEKQRLYHNSDLMWRQERKSNRTHSQKEETDHTQEPSLGQRFWRWLIPHCIFVTFVRLTTHCQKGFNFVKSSSKKCFQRTQMLLIKLWPHLRECTIIMGVIGAALFKWSLVAFIKLSLWNIKALMITLFRAFVTASGSPYQKLVCVGFAWQFTILGLRIGVWPWVGWLMLNLIHFSLIFIMIGVKCFISILLNTIASPSLLT